MTRTEVPICGKMQSFVFIAFKIVQSGSAELFCSVFRIRFSITGVTPISIGTVKVSYIAVMM